MCVIIDANLAAAVFAQSPDEDFRPVLDWLFDKDGRLVSGGKLTQELYKIKAARRSLRTLNQAGRAILVPDREVSKEEEWGVATGLCKSDDPHIIALARTSGARTLCSWDGDLHQDFKNRKLISNPRGTVYQKAEHTHLLRHTSSCRSYRSKRHS
jgi:hypothetical protein